MILSGFRVRSFPYGAHESANRSGRQRPGEGLPHFFLAHGEESYYSHGVGFAACGLWDTSKNSAEPIQRENLVSSQLVRPSDSQAQPSKGTQGKTGSNSPLAGGIKSRAVRSHLSLALGEFVRCNSRSPRRGNGQVRPKFERTRRSDVWLRRHGKTSVREIGKYRFRAPRSEFTTITW